MLRRLNNFSLDYTIIKDYIVIDFSSKFLIFHKSTYKLVYFKTILNFTIFKYLKILVTTDEYYAYPIDIR